MYDPPPSYAPAQAPKTPPRRGLLIAAIAVCAVFVVALVATAVWLMRPAHPRFHPWPGALKSPMQILPEQSEHPAPCAAGQYPSLDGRTCYVFGPGMTVLRAKNVRLDSTGAQDHGSPALEVSLYPEDGVRFTQLTRQVSDAYQRDPNGPAGHLGVVIRGQVVMAPALSNGPITGDAFQIVTPPSRRDQLGRIMQELGQ